MNMPLGRVARLAAITVGPQRQFCALFEDVVDNIRIGHQQSLLSLLGIGIGAAAVVALLSIGENTSEEAARQFQAMGTDLIVVQDGPSLGGGRKLRPLKLSDVSLIQERINAASVTAPIASATVKTRIGRIMSDVTAIGASSALLRAARLQLDHGRFISDEDLQGTVVVVGATLAKRMASSNGVLQVGSKIRMDDYLYTVVGVLRDGDRNPLLPYDFNNVLIVPLEAERRLSMSTGTLSHILIRVDHQYDPLDVLPAVSRSLEEVGSLAQVQGALQLIEGMRQQGQLFKWMLGGLGFVSLLVGGIGIMNTMLAGVREKRREIGLRLAIGARPSSVMLMVVLESTLLSLVGGAIGAVAGLLIAIAFAWLSGWAPTISYVGMVLGPGISVATGLFFGIYPAIKASQLSPIEALRAD